MAFIALERALEFVRSLREPLRKIAQHDAALVKQIRDAAGGGPANLAEGSRRSGGDRLYHYRVAAGETSEACVRLRTAEAAGYITMPEIATSLGLGDEVLAMCWRMTHPRRVA